MQLQYTLTGDLDLVFHTVEEEARYCMETAFLHYLVEKFGVSDNFNITTEHIKKSWTKMSNKQKTEMKNRAVFVWVARVAKKLPSDDLTEAGKNLPRSLFSLDRAWRKIYNFMNEKEQDK